MNCVFPFLKIKNGVNTNLTSMIVWSTEIVGQPTNPLITGPLDN